VIPVSSWRLIHTIPISNARSQERMSMKIYLTINAKNIGNGEKMKGDDAK